jgi:cob(I)alamin adenosyltransferase
MKIYTKKGDAGQTHLIGNVSKSKSDPVFDALGSLDELNSFLGVVVSFVDVTKEAKEFFLKTQNSLFDIGALIANPKSQDADFEWLKDLTKEVEDHIDELTSELSPLKNFILPGGSKGSALTHYARAVCRRVERDLVKLRPGNPAIPYINRLSDFLFTFARYNNLSEGVEDGLWKARK